MTDEKRDSIIPSEDSEEEVKDKKEDKSRDFSDSVFSFGFIFVRVFLPLILALVSIVIGFLGMNIWGLKFWTCSLVILGSILFTFSVIGLVNYIEDSKKDKQQKSPPTTDSSKIDNNAE